MLRKEENKEAPRGTEGPTLVNEPGCNPVILQTQRKHKIMKTRNQERMSQLFAKEALNV